MNIKFTPTGQKIEVVDKRTIWNAIKDDEFMAEMAKQFKPTEIQHGNMIWRSDNAGSRY